MQMATEALGKSEITWNLFASNSFTKHQAYRYGVSGFPTIKFFPKDNKDGEEVCAFTCLVYAILWLVHFVV